MKHTIPSTILLLLFFTLTGCASLSDRGAVTQSDYSMPDGTTMTMWDRTKVNLFVPSTQHVMVYENAKKTTQPDYTQQDGFAPGVIEATIHAAGLGVGLSQSGDSNTTNQSVSGTGSTATAGALGLGVGIVTGGGGPNQTGGGGE